VWWKEKRLNDQLVGSALSIFIEYIFTLASYLSKILYYYGYKKLNKQPQLQKVAH
jgi:hypothetical protein